MNDIVLDLTALLTYQTIFIVFIISFSVYFEVITRVRQKLSNQFEAHLQTAIKEDNIFMEYPPRCLQVRIVTPVLEKYNKKISGTSWEMLKEHLIHLSLRKEIEDNLKSRDWYKKSWAIRALNLSAKPEDEAIFIQNMSDNDTFIQTIALRGALKLHTYASIKAAVEQLSKLHLKFEFPFIDGLLAAPENVWKMLHRIFQDHPDLRLACMKLLSQKVGYLTFEQALELLNEEDLYQQKLAIEALSNVPSEKSINLLKELSHAQESQKRLKATYLLGKLRIQDTEHYQNLLKDESASVRLAAGWALSLYGAPIANEEVEKYIKAFPKHEIDTALAALTRIGN